MRRKSLWKPLICVALIATMMIGMCSNLMVVNAAKYSTTRKPYEIAVVYDNSGSMYNKGNIAWSQAKYAMEIFASMLDFKNGDSLKIFPMWEVSTKGADASAVGDLGPISVTSVKEIDQVTNMYTTAYRKDKYASAGDTPFAPITEAHEYLQTVTENKEKWLIVLTDGVFNQEARGTRANVDVQGKLQAMASDEIKIYYLGFDKASPLSANEAGGFYVESNTSASVQSRLVNVCNSIFQRAELKNKLDGNKLKLDLSMRKLIVFAQGANAQVKSLKGSSGNIDIIQDSSQRKANNIAAANYPSAVADLSLAGQVVTFDKCAKGNYTLNVEGSDQIQIFYEPDVDIEMKLVNSDGQEVDLDEKEIVAGDYTISVKLVDSVTGEDVTGSELMGDVKTQIKLKKSAKDKDGESVENGGTITINPADETYIYAKCTYLNDFNVTTDDNPEAFTFKVTAPNDKLSVEADVLQENNWYIIKQHESWKPIRVELRYDGELLSDEEMAKTKLTMTLKKDLSYRYEMVPGESAYLIYIGQNSNGTFVQPEQGKYKATISITYTDPFGEEVSASDKADFQIQAYSRVWKILQKILGILALIALILWWNLHKVYPKKMRLEMKAPNGNWIDKGRIFVGKKINISDDTQIMVCKTQKSTPHFKRKKPGATIKIKVEDKGAGVKDLVVAGEKIRETSDWILFSNEDQFKFIVPSGAQKKYRIKINS